MKTISAQYLKTCMKTKKDMKTLFTLLSFVFLSQLSFGQAPDYDDLKILYADMNYEKLVKEATKYTEDDKTKKDILPYIWCAKGYYKISKSGNTDDDFKNAYKDALKFLSKAFKYDIKYNDGVTIEEEREFIDELQMSLVEVIESEVSQGGFGFKRGYAWGIKYKKITMHPVGSLYMMGACKAEDNDRTTARTLWREADDSLANVTSMDDWSKADLRILKLGILYSASSLKNSRQEDAARELLGKASQWFEEDEDWQQLYDMIIN